ncbi:NucA/NucB deoxyribonuclease domain-containing protein [Capnocytophaga cynodegmi]
MHNRYKAQVKEVDELTHDIEITIKKSDYPETAQHIEDAIAKGHPVTVEIQRKLAVENRKAAVNNHPTKKGFDRDEWPMAMFSEGGTGASIRYINPSDNRGAGSAIGNALSNYPDGTIVKFIIVD